MGCHRVWVLGGTGRSGRAVARELSARGLEPVLVGRDAARLAAVGAAVGAADGAPVATVVAGSVGETAAAIRAERPAAVVNTIGPFSETAVPLARACLDVGAHYLDLANDLPTTTAVLDLDADAKAAGCALVAGAGFGGAATESLVVHMCEGEPAPVSVRVDAIASIATEEGRIGEALAATLVEGLAEGGSAGRRYRDGRLVRTRLASDPRPLRLPDGTEVTTVDVPFGELLAAQRASGAPEVVSASSELPSSPLVPLVLPVTGALLRNAAVRRFAVRRLAAVRGKARPQPREHSWAHATVRWADGRTREGWLRLGEAQAVTGAVPAETARRLLAGEGRPGAFTPAALFGTALVEACGGEFVAG